MLKLAIKNEKLRRELATKEVNKLLGKISFPFFYRCLNRKSYRYF